MKSVIRSCRIRLYPTDEQAKHLMCSMGANRFAYNWCLEHWKKEYEAGNKPTAYGMAKLFRANKPEWYSELDSEIVDRATANLAFAYKAMWRGNAKYPKFKCKGSNETYQVKSGKVWTDGCILKLPKCHSVRMARPLFHQGKIVGNVTIRLTAGRWYASIPVETEVASDSESQAIVGIDLGISTFATLSTGEKVENPKHYREAERRLAIRQRRLSRKVKGSNNRAKARFFVARTHAGIRNRRTAFLHSVTSDIAKRFGAVAIEDLNVSGMVRNRHLAKSISDASFREFRTQMEYKMPGRVFIADRFFASSKTCSGCGHCLDKLPLSVREWVCPSCGEVHDRDHNAAKNIVAAACRESTPTSAQADMTGACKDGQSGNCFTGPADSKDSLRTHKETK